MDCVLTVPTVAIKGDDDIIARRYCMRKLLAWNTCIIVRRVCFGDGLL